nr:TonB family protein [Kofleriaceae bacterium]
MTSARKWAAIVGATLGFHLAVLVAAYVFAILPDDDADAATSPARDAAPEAELKPSCNGDAMLALSARTAMCMAPWRDDADDCLYDAQMSLWLDLSSCQAQREPAPTTITMLSGKQADKVKPIDAEPLMEMLKPDPTPPPPQPQMVAVAPPPPPPPPAEARQRPQQVVETVKPQKDEPDPANARLLSEYNTNVEKEHVNRGARDEPLVAKAKPEELEPKKEIQQDPSVKEHDEDRDPGRDRRAPDVPGTLSMRNPGMPHPNDVDQDARTRGDQNGATTPASTDGVAQRKGDGEIEQEKTNHGETPKGDGGAGGGQPQVPNLRPTDEQLQRIVGGGSVDHLDDVDDGDETALNSKRWVYASFFNRMKRQVAQNWDPATVWRRVDPTGTVWGTKTRVTEVRVSLTPKGELTKILVTAPSGVGELDDEAIRAFHAASPFVNPPEGLINAKDNLITFAFSFYFEIGSPHMSWRMPRGGG